MRKCRHAEMTSASIFSLPPFFQGWRGGGGRSKKQPPSATAWGRGVGGVSFSRAEGTGLEPATPCGAIDFESTSSPIRIPSGSDHILRLTRYRQVDSDFRLSCFLSQLSSKPIDAVILAEQRLNFGNPRVVAADPQPSILLDSHPEPPVHFDCVLRQLGTNRIGQFADPIRKRRHARRPFTTGRLRRLLVQDLIKSDRLADAIGHAGGKLSGRANQGDVSK